MLFVIMNIIRSSYFETGIILAMQKETGCIESVKLPGSNFFTIINVFEIWYSGINSILSGRKR
jgi:hypothetical protein